jgi:hypothetical protein
VFFQIRGTVTTIVNNLSLSNIRRSIYTPVSNSEISEGLRRSKLTCASRKLISHTLMPPTVHNGDVDHRPLAQSRPLPAISGPGFRLPPGDSPPRTRRPRCQFSTISVNSKTQLVGLIQEHKYKCANILDTWSGKLRRWFSRGNQAEGPAEKQLRLLILFTP